MPSNEKKLTLHDIAKDMRDCAIFNEKCSLYDCSNLGTDALKAWAEVIEEAGNRFEYLRGILEVAFLLLSYVLEEYPDTEGFDPKRR